MVGEMAFRLRLGTAAVVLLATLVFSSAAFARGAAALAFTGGSTAERSQVTRALGASSFDWSVLPTRVTVHIGRDFDSEAALGEVWLDANVLDAGRFSWGVVQHEFAHQVDFQLLSADARNRFALLLGGSAWCGETLAFAHGDYGCERFASTLAWSYWPSASNCMKPTSSSDESAAMAPAAFRAALAEALHIQAPRYMRWTA
jgi:hypothetical protein